VRLLENVINGGAGNGITLGGALADSDTGTGTVGGDLPRPVSLTITGNIFRALVQDHTSTAAPRVDIYLTGSTPLCDTADSAGLVSGPVEPGNYNVTAGPGYRVTKVTDHRDAGGQQFIFAVARDPTISTATAFLYGIGIEGNDISAMGLSGIGF